MNQVDLVRATTEAQNGDEIVRERIIRHYKPYALNTVGHICKKYVSWSDEEASIGLLALNKAIDTYDDSKGRTFLNYVYLLINRDLIDFFRKEKREQHLSLSAENELLLEKDQSLLEYERSIQTSNLVEEILELSEALKSFQIEFEELEKYSPKHKDTRESLMELAATFTDDVECVQQFLKKRQFPATLFIKKTGYKLKTIERHRKYIVTLILLRLNPQWTQLSEFLQKGGNA